MNIGHFFVYLFGGILGSSSSGEFPVSHVGFTYWLLNSSTDYCWIEFIGALLSPCARSLKIFLYRVLDKPNLKYHVTNMRPLSTYRYKCPTDPFTILATQNPWMGRFYAVNEWCVTDFVAPRLRKGRSGEDEEKPDGFFFNFKTSISIDGATVSRLK